MKRKLIFILVFLQVAFPAYLALGAIFESAKFYSLERNQTKSGNFYVSGRSVNIMGNVEDGDLFGAGGDVFFSGSSSGDVNLAGGSINFSGNSGGDARLLGGDIAVTGIISNELLASGGKIDIGRSADIGSEAVLAGGEIAINGIVRNNLKLYGGKIFVNGEILGNLEADSSEIILGEEASVQGDFVYKSPRKADISSEAVVSGRTIFQESKEGEWKNWSKDFFSFLGIWWFLSLLIMLASGIIAFLIFGNLLETVVDQIFPGLGKELLFGFVFLIVVPFISAFFVASVVGFLIGLVLMAFYLLVLLFAIVLGPIIWGSFLDKLMFKTPGYSVTWRSLLIGIVTFHIFKYIPFVGWIFNLIFLALSAGALVSVFLSVVRAGRIKRT